MVVGAFSGLFGNPGSIKGTELVAIRTGIDFCLKNGFKDVCIFSGSLQAVQAIHSRVVDLSPVSSIILDILERFGSGSFLSLHHMKQIANVLAHRLARLALSPLFCCEWLEDSVPHWFSVMASHDLRI